jgi:hypothetical protein
MNNCPVCNHTLVNIIYGVPGKALVEMARSEDVALGGIKKALDCPTLYCYSCNETVN